MAAGPLTAVGRGVRAALQLAQTLVFAVMVVVAATMLVVNVITYTGVVRIRHEITGSMMPVIRVGDLVVYRPVRSADLRASDVIGFSRGGGRTEVTHRVTSVTVTGPTVTVWTRGDANPGPDPEPVTFASGATVWRAWHVVPAVGRPLTQLSGGHGLPFVLGLLGLYLTLPWIERQLPGPARGTRRTGRHRRPAGAPAPARGTPFGSHRQRRRAPA